MLFSKAIHVAVRGNYEKGITVEDTKCECEQSVNGIFLVKLFYGSHRYNFVAAE